jgi:hypothetical protein
MKTTLRQLDQALETLAKGMPRTVADYFWGDWNDSFEGRVQKYPAIVCNVSPNIPFSKVTTLTLNIVCVDQVSSDQKNLKDVESDTLQVLHDFYRVIKHSPNWKGFCAIQSAGANLKFKDSSPDEVAGWQSSIVLKLIESEGMCDIPLVDYDINKKINC